MILLPWHIQFLDVIMKRIRVSDYPDKGRGQQSGIYFSFSKPPGVRFQT